MIGLTIAGFDPSGGAGVLRDIHTFRDLNIHPTAVVTSLTAQNPNKFFSTYPIGEKYIEEQIDSIFDEYSIEYGKTGMLYNEKIVKKAHKKLKEYDVKYVVDPVIVSSSGGALSDKTFIKSLKKKILNDSILTTPNIKEAEDLSNIKINSADEAIEASRIISKHTNVLITGGHLNGMNVLNIDGKIETFKTEILKTNSTHGSGCGLSAAITGYLIKGNDLKTSIKLANKYIYKQIKNCWYGTLR
ncbi:bifunctional hydroxymethylpyrimidine kinase/phosphomethylpyrimidine kinase [Methanobrevibacter curvatus]|uniref:Hydroxymethylpyrimidine/phosphomethylpyrimidine kinase n=1 Tax=Methanobrevibacter curvatus TaxID=49547 RepID=A0A166C1H4_9EURY|nr:bifunctional hydroxymethylpyrimidine kinase/phosphomethylpyrimidine kinase [Methanobrevibacter curvatus]KZX14032.1 hydroxymethylpyrimidine/phosphomethylpyrimidine kinase [Methanobrevibacter curvatus]